jgi:two-component system phosphate regulon sensor histidine kinase PhoR
VYLVEGGFDDPSILEYRHGDGSFAVVDEPALESSGVALRELWTDGASRGTGSMVISIRGDRPPSVVRENGRSEIVFAPRTPSLVILIDQTYLAMEILPDLIGRYLGDPETFHTAVVDEGSGEVLYSTVDVEYEWLSDPDRFTPDLVLPLSPYGGMIGRQLGALVGEAAGTRDPSLLQWSSFRELVGQMRPVAPTEDVAFAGSRSGLQLYAWHTAGSIQRATMIELRYNLLFSYAVLLLLAGVSLGFFLQYRRAVRLRDREHEFMATVTHELRTPIAAMHAAADNLADGIVTRPQQIVEYGHALLDEGKRLRSLVDHVLLYAGLQGSPQPLHQDVVDLRKAVETAIDHTASLSELVPEIDPAIPNVVCDSIALEAVLVNLLTNAVKHNEPGTRVSLSVLVDRISKPTTLEIRVSDEGIGIPRDEVKRIREPFFRGESSRARQVPGTGLGLSLVHRIAQTFKGVMTIDSTPGEGTTVTVRIPVVIPDE